MKRRKTASASLDARPAAEWNSVPGEPADADDDQAGPAVADTQLDPADEQDAAEDIEHEEGEEEGEEEETELESDNEIAVSAVDAATAARDIPKKRPAAATVKNEELEPAIEEPGLAGIMVPFLAADSRSRPASFRPEALGDDRWARCKLEIDDGMMFGDGNGGFGDGIDGRLFDSEKDNPMYLQAPIGAVPSAAGPAAAGGPCLATPSGPSSSSSGSYMASLLGLLEVAKPESAPDYVYNYDDEHGKACRRPRNRPKSYPDFCETESAAPHSKGSDAALAQWRDGTCWPTSTLTVDELSAKRQGGKVKPL